MTIWERDVGHHTWGHTNIDRQTLWLTALASAAVGSWIFALLVIAQDNAFP